MSLCQYCNESLKGRSDKKFCSDYCRVSFHNGQNQKANSKLRVVNRILRRNRMILFQVYSNGIRHIKIDHLLALGFNTQFFTQQMKHANGKLFIYCYDMAYSTDNYPEVKIEQISRSLIMDMLLSG